ncbi:MAG: polynucleotide adenylyltransferase PcnB [Methylococcales bacterium]|nr:polynucleotide adenylyltransferase PcnB [Methylococcales bacterium]MDD5753495.1 polynucleotide adenylyltransferase PcnB [Methylococcales bacterium]
MNAILTFLKNFADSDKKPIRSAKVAREKFIEKSPELPRATETYNGATVIPRPEHNVSRQQISENALKVVYKLKKEGFDAYLVGGCVRDLLLGREPKDFDVVTNALPEQLSRLFSNCRIIGKRFRLAHIIYGRDIVEVATFRKSGSEKPSEAQRSTREGRILQDNLYGSIDDDVWRRDFTINALYYNIRDFSIVDYVGGMADIQAGLIRLIGDANERFREDPVRMLRAVRFAVKLGFKLHVDCEQAIHLNAHLLASIPAARLHDEVTKLFLSGYGVQTFEMLRHYGLFEVLFPAVEKSLSLETSHFPKMMVINALQNSDKRVEDGKQVTPYFLFAALLYEPMLQRANEKVAKGMLASDAHFSAASEILTQQVRRISLPRHLTLAIREVWNQQEKFEFRVGAKASKLLVHPRFRAAYDFLVLRAQAGSVPMELAEWWTTYQKVSDSERRKMTLPQAQPKSTKPKKKRTYRKKAKTSPVIHSEG